jgi:GPH family glycoside/pentoside/hexuronide:cation symporter/probable glucitol transport protein GutA
MLDISLVGLLGIAVGLPVIMRLCKGVRKAFSVSQIAVLLCSVLTYFAGKNLPLLFVVSGAASFFATMSMAFNSMLMTEMTDLIYFEKNSMMNGIMAALKGFSNKCGIAVTSGIISLVLTVTGYIAGAVGGQNQATLAGINGIRFIVPAAMAIIILISLRAYPVTNELREKFRALYQKKESDLKEE